MWSGPALLHLTYSGSSNFVVTNYGLDDQPIEQLVNTIGQYEGTRPLDFLEGQHTARLEIKAKGAWEAQILPFEAIRYMTVPSTVSGKGDDVLYQVYGAPDLLKIDASKTTGHFVVWAYANGRHFLVNEIGPYAGTIIVPRDAISKYGYLVLVIEAAGDWSIEVTNK